MSADRLANRLAQETSPYLLQHADNPVHWQAWSPETLALAQDLGKPILLSVGYAACHWCHVMAHESFEDAEVAAVMNELFVNVKVDREERPDIDTIYQQALALLGEQGGWPLTMFLTPAGEPFWGGTYFPKTPRFGRPGFPDVLRQVAMIHSQQQDKVAGNVAKLKEAMVKLSTPEPGSDIPVALIDEVAKRLAREVDPFLGGIGRAPKFPQPTLLLLLWRAWQRTGLVPFSRGVRLSLDQMCQGGIYDHLTGGFARYATDDAWLVPHFEKMLYDNGQLLELLAIVAREVESPLYRSRIAETVDWTLQRMITPTGAFAASYDADSEGEEGKFAVWTEAEIDAALADFPETDRALFKRLYDVTPEGNWEGRTIPNRSARLELETEEVEARLAAMRAALLAARDRRVQPGWDDKVLADWNGLMIVGLVEAGITLSRADWIAAARKAFDAIVQTHDTGDGRLHHSYRQERAAHPAAAEDYANLIRGGIRLHEATGDPAILDQARRWTKVLDAHYWDPAAGGYFTSADDTTDVIHRTKSAMDNAVPAANGTMAIALSRLWLLTGETGYRDRAEALVQAYAGEVARSLAPLASLLNGAELLHGARQVVIVGEGGEALRDLALRAAGPDRVVQWVAPGALPQGHPAAGKQPVEGKPAAYICDGPVCSLPITDSDQMIDRLARPLGETGDASQPD